MSLPACQERVLSAMENALRVAEPRLASRFAIFARLASGEALPRTRHPCLRAGGQPPGRHPGPVGNVRRRQDGRPGLPQHGAPGHRP